MVWSFGAYLSAFQIWGSLDILLYKILFLFYWIPSFPLVGKGRRKYEIQQWTKGISNGCQNGSAPLSENKWALLLPIKYQLVGY